MNPLLEDLIKQPEPRSLEMLHVTKVALAILGLLSLPVALIMAVFGVDEIWLVVATLWGAAILTALIANECSMIHFARRAQAFGVTSSEARSFWRSYDWDQDDA